MMHVEDPSSKNLYYAKTILKQAGKLTLIAIGCQKPVALEETEGRRGGVQFKVNSPKPRQYCRVELTWMDLYKITHFRLKRGTFDEIVIDETDGVFCDQLSDELWNTTQH